MRAGELIPERMTVEQRERRDELLRRALFGPPGELRQVEAAIDQLRRDVAATGQREGRI